MSSIVLLAVTDSGNGEGEQEGEIIRIVDDKEVPTAVFSVCAPAHNKPPETEGGRGGVNFGVPLDVDVAVLAVGVSRRETVLEKEPRRGLPDVEGTDGIYADGLARSHLAASVGCTKPHLPNFLHPPTSRGVPSLSYH